MTSYDEAYIHRNFSTEDQSYYTNQVFYKIHQKYAEILFSINKDRYTPIHTNEDQSLLNRWDENKRYIIENSMWWKIITQIYPVPTSILQQEIDDLYNIYTRKQEMTDDEMSSYTMQHGLIKTLLYIELHRHNLQKTYTSTI